MSERFLTKTGNTYMTMFRVMDPTTRTAVTGLANGAFTKYLYKDGAASGQTVTVTEIANGQYKAEYTPNTDGYWVLVITNASYSPEGWQDDVQAVPFAIDDVVHRAKNSTVNDAGATTTGFVTALTDATDYNTGLLLVFTSGALKGVGRWVKSYDTGTKAVTVDTLPAAPANGDAFDLLSIASPDQIAQRVLVKKESDVEAEMSTNYRCLAGVVARETHKNDVVSDTLHVKKADQTTDLFTAALTRDTGQTPVKTVAPA